MKRRRLRRTLMRRPRRRVLIRHVLMRKLRQRDRCVRLLSKAHTMLVLLLVLLLLLFGRPELLGVAVFLRLLLLRL